MVQKIPRSSKEEIRERSRTQKVITVCGIVASVLFLVLIARLAVLQIRDHEKYTSLAVNQQVSSTEVLAKRGSIYDSTHKTLAVSSEAYNVFISPAEMAKYSEDGQQIAADLATMLKVDENEILRAEQDTESWYEIIARKVDRDAAEAVRSYIDENDLNSVHLEAVQQAFEAAPGAFAAVVLEPIAGNMGVVPPAEGYLQGLRDLCTQHDVLLIFDEVITGFRAALGGAQELYGVLPDLCTFGKIIGGGFPVGCFAGRADIMDTLAPVGPVYQAGTLSGNPVAMVAGLAQLTELEKPGTYERLEALGARLEAGLQEAIESAGIEACVNRAGSVATLFFSAGPIRNWTDAAACDTESFARYFRGMLERGFLIAPSQYEALFVSTAHTEEEIDAFTAAAKEVLANL